MASPAGPTKPFSGYRPLRAAQRSQTPRGPTSKTQGIAATHFSRRTPPRSNSTERKDPLIEGTPTSAGSDGSSPSVYEFDRIKKAQKAIKEKRQNSQIQSLGRARSSSLDKVEVEKALSPSQRTCRMLYYTAIKSERDDFKSSLVNGCPLEYPFFRKFAEGQGMKDLPEILTKADILLLQNQFAGGIEQIYNLYKVKLKSEYDVYLERLGTFFDRTIEIDTLELTIQAVSNLKLVADRLYENFHENVEPDPDYFEADSIPSKVYYVIESLINNHRWLQTTQVLDFSKSGITRLPLGLHLLKFEHLLHVNLEDTLLSEIPVNWFRQSFSNMLTMKLAYNRIKKVAWDFGNYFTNKFQKVSLAHQKIREPLHFPFKNFEERTKTFTLDLEYTPVHSPPKPEDVEYTLITTATGA